jgi:coenzyme F420 biosynthesis associated uncharacterized protein
MATITATCQRPPRLRRLRKGGWRKPAGSICVDRGGQRTPGGETGRWDNPFPIGPDCDAAGAVLAYRTWLAEQPDLIEQIRTDLAGKTLLCWCEIGQPCHADVLLEIANTPRHQWDRPIPVGLDEIDADLLLAALYRGATDESTARALGLFDVRSAEFLDYPAVRALINARWAPAVPVATVDWDRLGTVLMTTGLDAPEDTAPVLVVDRRGWVQANADGFARIIEPLVERLAERKGVPQGLSLAVGSRVTGAEVGLLLGFLGSKVLGQFDPFHDPAGRLLLVAPNVVHVERELDVDPHDFRLWVCLHEETHRVQFTAVPWLSSHLEGEIQSFVRATQVDTGALAANLREMIEALIRAIRGGRESISLMDMLQSAEQKAVVKRVTALMSLLEGHADVVMDKVGPEIIPTVETIRRRFQNRRKSKGMERTVRKALGVDATLEVREAALVGHDDEHRELAFSVGELDSLVALGIDVPGRALRGVLAPPAHARAPTTARRAPGGRWRRRGRSPRTSHAGRTGARRAPR